MFSLLYVDDEPGLLELGKLFLESTGDFEVTTALSAGDGLEQLAQRDFDAIVSDFQMPGMDGIELLKRVRKSFGSIPFVLFTGRGREEVVIEAINNGVDFYLQKGGDPKAQFAELAHKVRQAVTRRRAETALSDSEKRLADIINFLPDATFAIDTRGVVIAWSRAMETMTGVSSAAVLGRANFEYALPFYKKRRPLLIDLILNDDPVIAAKYPFVKREGKTLFSEITIPHLNNGRGADLWFTASPLYNGNGEMIGAIESIREITERKRAEEKLVTANQEYTNLLDQIQDVYYRTDTGGQLVKASRSWAALFGYDDISECLGKNIADNFYFNPSDRKQLLGEIARNGKVTGYEVILKKKDGAPVLVEVSSHPYYDPAGKVIGIEGTFRDITARKKADEELMAANEQLVASDEELREQYDELASSERRIRMSEARLQYMLGFYEYAQKSERELLKYAIEGAGIVTGSPLGYLAFLNEDESELSMYAWSESAMTECSMRDKPIVYKTKKTGLWGEAVRQRRPVITNDYAAPDPAKKGYPEGHPRIIRHMNVPVIEDGHVVLVAGVANKSSDYSDNDVSELTLLMQGLWTILKQRRGQEELRMVKISVDQAADEVFWMDFEGSILYVNDAACRINGYSRDEFLKMTIYDLNPDLTRDIWTGSVTDLRAKKTQLFTTRHRHRDGKIIDVEIMSVYVRQDKKEYSFAFVRDITERKRTEEALFNSQQMLQLVLDTIPQRVFWKDRNSVYLGCNMPLARDAGYTNPADLIGKDDFDTASKATADLYRADDQQVMETGQPRLNFEEPQIKPDGSHAWLRTSKVPLRDRRESIIGVLGTYEDITDLKHAEESLHENEEKYRTLVESSFDGIAIHQDGILVYVNRTAAHILGADDPELFIGKSAIDIVAPAYRELIAKRVREAPESMQELIREQFLRLDGNSIDVDVMTKPSMWKGRPAAYVTFRDVTAQLRADEALRESSRKYAELFELGSEAIFLIDNETGALLETNSAACEMYGYPRDILLTMKNTDLSAEQEDTRKITEETPQGIVRVPLRYHRRRDGTVFPVEIIGRFFAWNRRPVHIAAIRDITEHKRAEAALRESEEKYRMLVEQSRDGVFIIQDGRLVFYNGALAGLTGYTAEDLDGRLLSDLIAPEDRELVLSRARDRAEGRRVPDLYEISLLHKDGIGRTRVRVRAGLGTFRGRPASIGTFYDITEDRRREEALRESEEKYRTLVEVNRDIIYSLSTDGTVLYVSPQTKTLLGYRPDEMEGRNFSDFVHPDDVEKLVRHIQEHFDAGKPVPSDRFRVRRNDGTYRWFEDKTIYATDPRGNSIVAGTIRDITDEKAVQDALRESEEKFRALVETTGDFIWETDAAGKYTYVSPQVRDILGYEPGDLVGRTPFDIMPRDEAEKISAGFNHLVASRLPVTGLENKAIRKDGSVVILETSGVVRTTNDGSFLGYRGIDRDITVRKQAENALRDSEERTRTILNTAQAGIVLVDAVTHQIVDANKKALELIGLDRGSVVGTICHRFICPAEMGKCPVTDLGQQVDTSERVLITAAGEKIPVLKTVVPVTISGRNILIESFVDISEQKRSEAAIREANRKLNLLYSITRHDIRNQLMVAQGFAQLAALSKPDATVLDFLAKITAAIEMIQRQIEFTKAYQELGVHAPSWFLLGEVISSVRPGMIALRNTCNPVEIYADPMIDKVFFNLFDNAMKYGERVTEVTVGCKETDDYLIITFADNGCGIPPAEKKKIFEKGYGKNTGLGLFLVREILAITGITIHETGTYGKGAVFEIIIPKGTYRITSSR